MSRRSSNPADRRPTWTSLTVRALADYDDFLTREDLAAATGASHNQLCAALHHLTERAGVVGTVRDGDRTYYFLTGEDRRSATVEERAPEPPGNRCRRRRAPPGQPLVGK